MEPMADDEVKRRLDEVEWIRRGDRIETERTFDGFTDAVEFVNRVAEIAEDQFHHPDIHLEDYNRVRLSVTTHDAGGLTERDFELARAVDELED